MWKAVRSKRRMKKAVRPQAVIGQLRCAPGCGQPSFFSALFLCEGSIGHPRCLQVKYRWNTIVAQTGGSIRGNMVRRYFAQNGGFGHADWPCCCMIWTINRSIPRKWRCCRAVPAIAYPVRSSSTTSPVSVNILLHPYRYTCSFIHAGKLVLLRQSVCSPTGWSGEDPASSVKHSSIKKDRPA